MSEEALLLTNGRPAEEIGKAAKVLRFFGIPERALAVEEFEACMGATQEGSVKYRLFCSTHTFTRLMAGLEESPERVRRWQENVHSAFVYADDECGSLEKLARALTGDARATLMETADHAGDFVVSKGLKEFCGAMRGVRLAAAQPNATTRLAVHNLKENAAEIISIGAGAVFLKLRYQKIDVFLSTSKEIIDIDLELPNGVFDIREHVLSALPIVLYLKWAFPLTCWRAFETNACLIIDDPVLKPTYGFVDFRNLLDLMKRHSFSSNIAFIPWNWRRSHPEVARMFRENPREYSISIHGCDHTQGEFGSADRGRLYWKAKQAVERMSCHEANTGIAFDRVMVFPQGVFSEAAMNALKHTELIGAVNNDTISVDPDPRAIRVSDVWDVAVMGYSDFPLFTRRYPWEGIENFAFDSLLGKPAISVIHHDFCRDRCARLLEFVEGLNALSCRLEWRSLAEVVRRSFRQRQLQGGVTEIEMYGAELRMENGSDDTRHFSIRKRERDPGLIKGIEAGSRQVLWEFAEGYLNFGLELKSGESLMVRVEYRELSDEGRIKESGSYKLQTMLRRCLSEARDNYAMKFRPTTVSRFLKVD